MLIKDNLPKKRILIVDDQEEVLALLRDSLVSAGYEIMVCIAPKNAFAAIKSFKPDLILLDLLMPDLGGLEICEILNNNQETHGIPIIIISGFGNLVDIKKAYQLGAVGYLVKPFPLESLSKEISKAITNRENPL
ncbi:MAG: response regulator [Candidatus Omnitrophota bacterium]